MKKFLKLFFVYSYLTLLCYVGSENSLVIARATCGEGRKNKTKLKFEWLWKTTLERWKETIKLIMEN